MHGFEQGQDLQSACAAERSFVLILHCAILHVDTILYYIIRYYTILYDTILYIIEYGMLMFNLGFCKSLGP